MKTLRPDEGEANRVLGRRGLQTPRPHPRRRAGGNACFSGHPRHRRQQSLSTEDQALVYALYSYWPIWRDVRTTNNIDSKWITRNCAYQVNGGYTAPADMPPMSALHSRA